MNKISKTILIILIAIFGASLLLVNSAQAQVDELVVEFENTPLFDEANFLPGESVIRWVKVTNNSGQPQRIATEAINVTDIDNLGDNLELVIQEGVNVLYSDSLTDFFNDGETYLSDLATNASTTYNFSISFIPGAEGPQGATLSFDILVGYQGAAGGVPPGTPPSGGGGGGGGGPLGLTIKYEKEIYVATTTATISWFTSYKATSRVIYSQDGQPHNFDLTDTVDDPPLYGYVYTTPEYHTLAIEHGVTYREITITGLLPNTTYYFRCISHASPPSISQEHSFTTLAVEQGEGEGEVEVPEGEIEEPGPEVGPAESPAEGGLVIGPAGEEEEEEEEAGEAEEEEEAGEEEEIGLGEEEPTQPGFVGNLLAGIGGFASGLGGWWIILIIIILLLILLIAIRRRKRED